MTADGQGALAVSSAGQFYAYGTARPWNSPTGFTGSIVDVSITADGQGAAALSGSGQIYAYGSVRYLGNGDWGCKPYSGTLVCLDILAEYERLGPRGFLGAPSGNEFSVAGGRGRAMHFQGGSIYWTKETGAHEVHVSTSAEFWFRHTFRERPVGEITVRAF